MIKNDIFMLTNQEVEHVMNLLKIQCTEEEIKEIAIYSSSYIKHISQLYHDANLPRHKLVSIAWNQKDHLLETKGHEQK